MMNGTTVIGSSAIVQQREITPKGPTPPFITTRAAVLVLGPQAQKSVWTHRNPVTLFGFRLRFSAQQRRIKEKAGVVGVKPLDRVPTR